MTSWLTPDAVNGLTVGSLMVVGAALFMLSVAKGWIVLGWQYRQDIERLSTDNKALQAALVKRDEVDELKNKTIATQAETIRNNNATGEGALKMLQTFRDLTELTSGGGGA